MCKSFTESGKEQCFIPCDEYKDLKNENIYLKGRIEYLQNELEIYKTSIQNLKNKNGVLLAKCGGLEGRILGYKEVIEEKVKELHEVENRKFIKSNEDCFYIPFTISKELSWILTSNTSLGNEIKGILKHYTKGGF